MAGAMEFGSRWPNALSLAFVEELYAAWAADPSSVSEDWRTYFASLRNGDARPRVGPSFSPHSVFNPGNGASTGDRKSVV